MNGKKGKKDKMTKVDKDKLKAVGVPSEIADIDETGEEKAERLKVWSKGLPKGES